MRSWLTRRAAPRASAFTGTGALTAIAAFIAIASFVALASAATTAPPAVPTSDPFYTYSGSLRNIAPGTVLRTRQVALSIQGAPTAYPATQVLYRTTNQLGEADATVATIIRPSSSAPVTKIVSDQIAYDCDAAYGRPSYQLQGGQPQSGYITDEAGPMLSYLTQGWTIVTSDYEGPTDDYGAGRESGYGTLDGIRAAENLLHAAATTPVGIVGSSGGAIATMWAAEEQRAYAPGVHLIGVVSGGIPVDYAHVIDYINGTNVVGNPAGALPYVLEGLFKAYHVDVAKYLTPGGIKEMQLADQGCLGGSAGTTAFKIQSILKPQYQNWEQDRFMVKIVNDSIMGREGTPNAPMLIGAGNYDGTGDGIMPAKDEQQLAYEYCQGGGEVTYQDDPGGEHVVETEVTDAQAPTFFQEALSGVKVDGCSSITPGTPLTPLPVPTSPTMTTPRLLLRVVGVQRGGHALVLRLAARGGTISRCSLVLTRSKRVVARASVVLLTARSRRVILRARHPALPSGRYSLIARIGGRTVARRTIVIRTA